MNNFGFIGKIFGALLLSLLFGWAATHILGMEVPSLADGGFASELTNTIVWSGGAIVGGLLGYRFTNYIYEFLTTVIFSAVVDWFC